MSNITDQCRHHSSFPGNYSIAYLKAVTTKYVIARAMEVSVG